ncbi:M16 family metallopeptidase [Caminibacter pacificus]
MYFIYEKDALGRTIFEIVFKNTGSIYAKDAVAYMTAHILNTKGTLDKKEKFYSQLEEKAINLTITTNKEFSTVSMTFLNEKSSFAVKKLIELLQNPNFTQEALEKSKKEILAKKENLKNNHDYIASKNLFKAIFKNTPLERETIGENIQNVTLEDIKEHFSYFAKENAVFINGGKKIDIAEFIETLPNTKPKNDLFFKPKQSHIEEKREVEQSYIYFAAPFEVKKEEYYLAKIATFILGAGGFGSRMMEEIRVKRGYAYSAYAMNEFKKSYQILKGHLQTKLENTIDAKNLVVDIINAFLEKGITQEELDSAKKFLIGSEPLRNETLSQRLLRKFNEYYLGLGDGYFEKELNLIKNTTLDEINDFIKRHKEIKNLSFSVVTNDKN